MLDSYNEGAGLAEEGVLLANGQARRKVLLHIFTVVSARLNKALEIKNGHGKVPEPGVRQASPSTKSMEHHCF